MNNKNQYCKYVYVRRDPRDNCSYYRKGTRLMDGNLLWTEFPLVAKVVGELRGYIEYDNIKAWIDKHGNVIVRTFHEDKQTKIDF